MDTLRLICCIVVSLLLIIVSDSYALSSVSDQRLIVQKIADGFDKSSGFEFIGRDILVIQKDDGKVKLIRDFELKQYSILDVNVFNRESDSGLLGITSANVNGTTHVFLLFTENNSTDGGAKFEYGLGNRIYQYEWNSTSLELTNAKLILDLPSAPAVLDAGGKITIGPDDQLYVAIGDLVREGKEQNMPDKDPSKVWPYDNKTESSGILRLTFDGQPSPGNPFSENGFERYFAYGIRHPSGLAFDPLTGNLWDIERGPTVFDELNLVEAGFNSGWKQVQGRTTDICCISDYYYASRLSQDVDKLYSLEGSHYSEPEYVWTEAPAISALTFLNSDMLGKSYTNDLFVGDIQGNIYHFELDQIRESLSLGDLPPTLLGNGFGSIAEMKTGPDGALYILTYSGESGFPIGDNNGSLYRVANTRLELPILESIVMSDYYAIIAISIITISIPAGLVAWKKYSKDKVG